MPTTRNHRIIAAVIEHESMTHSIKMQVISQIFYTSQFSTTINPPTVNTYIVPLYHKSPYTQTTFTYYLYIYCVFFIHQVLCTVRYYTISRSFLVYTTILSYPSIYPLIYRVFFCLINL